MRFVWIAVVAAAVAAVPAQGAPSAPPKCATSRLVIWLGPGEGAAGTTFLPVRFTNLSGHTCTLRGFPGVSAVKLNGQQLGSAAAHDDGGVHTVTLASGHTAEATLGIAQAANFTASACGLTTAAGLRVKPPNQTASTVVPLVFNACSHTGPAYLHVRVVS